MSGRTVRPTDKSFPTAREGEAIDRLAIPLGEFSTPLLVLNDTALRHNIRLMADWMAARGLELMPHGKTTMAPELWHRQLAAGATGITVATGWQAIVALHAGVRTVQLANSCVDPQSLRALATWLDAHPDQELVTWADSPTAVERLEEAAEGPGRIGVLVELGAEGARTGFRDEGALIDTADRVTDSPNLTLRGVAGYEGALAHDRSPTALGLVREFCDRMVEVLARLRDRVEGTPWITAGGSAYFDVVADSFAIVTDARAIVRSGAYIVHDSGHYHHNSPLGAAHAPADAERLTAAMVGYARVVSCPEPGLALLDGGKRDFPYDEGLPTPFAVASALGGPERPLEARISALNDQHAFLRWEGPAPVRVGDVVMLGLSHPCTAFDKWRLIPVVDDRGMVIEAIRTYF